VPPMMESLTSCTIVEDLKETSNN